MKSIYASKLYKASKHKDKIHSAINDPLNVELVQQLKEYLDEPEEVEVETKVSEVSEVEDKSNSENTSTRENKSSGVSVAKSSSPTSTSPSSGDNAEDESDKESSESKEEKPVKEDNEDNKQDVPEMKKSRSFHSPKKSESKDENSTESKVEESVTVESATVLYQQPVQAGHCCHGDFVDTDAIKGTLNVREDTKGVSRIFIKDDELWIYYQDKINLNSVMEPVISVLNGTGFTNLEFNRLARTENAIVFQISCVFNQIEPMKVEDE